MARIGISHTIDEGCEMERGRKNRKNRKKVGIAKTL